MNMVVQKITLDCSKTIVLVLHLSLLQCSCLLMMANQNNFHLLPMVVVVVVVVVLVMSKFVRCLQTTVLGWSPSQSRLLLLLLMMLTMRLSKHYCVFGVSLESPTERMFSNMSNIDGDDHRDVPISCVYTNCCDA